MSYEIPFVWEGMKYTDSQENLWVDHTYDSEFQHPSSARQVSMGPLTDSSIVLVQLERFGRRFHGC